MYTNWQECLHTSQRSSSLFSTALPFGLTRKSPDNYLDLRGSQANLEGFLVTADRHEAKGRENTEGRSKRQDAHERARSEEAEGAQKCTHTEGAERGTERPRRKVRSHGKIGMMAVAVINVGALLLFDRFGGLGGIFNVGSHRGLACSIHLCLDGVEYNSRLMQGILVREMLEKDV